jgi:hypothetical protein
MSSLDDAISSIVREELKAINPTLEALTAKVEKGAMNVALKEKRFFLRRPEVLMVGSLGWSPVRSSVGGEAELAALLSPLLGEGLGQLGQREPVLFLAVDQCFDNVGGQGRQLEDAGYIRAINVEGTGKLADGLDLAGFEDVGPRKGPCQCLEDGGLYRLLRPPGISPSRAWGAIIVLRPRMRRISIGMWICRLPLSATVVVGFIFIGLPFVQ